MLELSQFGVTSLTEIELRNVGGGDAYGAGLRLGRAIRAMIISGMNNYSNPRYSGDWQM